MSGLTKIPRFLNTYRIQTIIVLVGIIFYAVCIIGERHFVTGDTTLVQIPWWDYLLQHGWHGIATLNNSIAEGGANGDYTTVWYAVIVVFEKIGFYPHWPIEYSIKAMAVICSLVSAVAMFFLTRHFRSQSKYLPAIIAVLTLFMPAFLMDVVKTNLPDSLYLMFMLVSLLAFVKNKKGTAWLLIGIGACFKLMAVYLIPFYLYFYFKNWKISTIREKFTPIIAGCAAILICSIPNFLAGGEFMDGIINPIFGRSQSATQYGLNFWRFIPNNAENFNVFCMALLLLTLIATFFFIKKFITNKRLKDIEYPVLLTLIPLLCYFFLPSQHEGYFAFATIAALLAWIVVMKKRQFIIFLYLNILLFVSYYLITFRWWFEVIPQLEVQILALFMIGIIGFHFYLLFQVSVLNKSKDEKLIIL